jgi:hypothetical protein
MDNFRVENRLGKMSYIVQLVSCVTGQVPGDKTQIGHRRAKLSHSQVPGDVNSGVLGVLERMDHDLTMRANDRDNPRQFDANVQSGMGSMLEFIGWTSVFK